MGDDSEGSWLPFGLAGLVSLCCVGLGTILGGATLGATAGTTVASSGASGLAGLLVSGAVTLLTVAVLGFLARRRAA